MRKYGATSDIELSLKTSAKDPSKFEKIKDKMHHILYYNEITHSFYGLTSITTSNVLEI